MARKVTGFNREQLNWYRRLKASDFTDADIARIAGVSRSSVGRWKRGEVQMAARTWGSVIERERTGVGWRGEQIGRYTTITYAELERMTVSSNIRTQRAARQELDRLDGMGYTVAELQAMGLRGELQRPRITRTVKGKRFSYLLGRGKSAEQRRAVEAQLREQGIDPADYGDYYDEATGYTTL